MLDFDNEAVDSGRLITAQYGSLWAGWLLGVAKQLTNPEIWNPESQVDLAVQYANELVVRLMGVDVMSLQDGAQYPLTIPIVGLRPSGSEECNLNVIPLNTYFPLQVYSKALAGFHEWTRFEVYLVAGSYILDIWAAKSDNRAKLQVTCVEAAIVADTVIDLYASPTEYDTNFELAITVPASGFYTLCLNKYGYNPLSLGTYLAVSALIIRRAD